MARLTDPQRVLLTELEADGPAHVSSTYRPAMALIAAGYAEFTRGKWSDLLRITDAGRRALSSQSQEPGSGS